MAKILIKDLHFGGLSDSLLSGIPNSIPRMFGLNLHDKPGVIQVNQKMKKDSGSTIDALCKAAVNCSNGIKYWFSSTSGKIWQESGSTYTLVYTTSPTRGGAGTLGAYEYNGYIYWATEKMLHRIKITGADGSSEWTTNAVPNWQELNLDQTLGSTGNTYTNTTGVNEGATHKQTFTAVASLLESVSLNVGSIGTGNWTVTVHDSSNNSLGSKQITNGSMATGFKLFTFDDPIQLVTGSSYHIHVHSSVADGTTVASTSGDFETSNVKLYSSASDTYKPMKEVNQVLYIGDRNRINQVDGETYTYNALDLPSHFTVSALAKSNTDLLIGTIIATTVNRCSLFKWNTWSVTFSSEYELQENGIFAFLEADGYILLFAGQFGNIYVIDGPSARLFKKIPGTFSASAKATVYPYATVVYKGNPLFGVSNVTGDPCDQGMYSLARRSQEYPLVLNLEYATSNLDGDSYERLSGIEIGAIIVSGQTLYAAWAYNSTYGVDVIDTANKVGKAFLETRVIEQPADPEMTTNYRRFAWTYLELPANTSVVLKHKTNHATSYSNIGSGTAGDDSDRKVVYIDTTLGATSLQVRTELIASSNNAPSLRQGVIEFSD